MPRCLGRYLLYTKEKGKKNTQSPLLPQVSLGALTSVVSPFCLYWYGAGQGK